MTLGIINHQQPTIFRKHHSLTMSLTTCIPSSADKCQQPITDENLKQGSWKVIKHKCTRAHVKNTYSCKIDTCEYIHPGWINTFLNSPEEKHQEWNCSRLNPGGKWSLVGGYHLSSTAGGSCSGLTSTSFAGFTYLEWGIQACVLVPHIIVVDTDTKQMYSYV